MDVGLAETNLSRIWAELRAERAEPIESERRRLEALLARDPDEDAGGAVEALLADTSRFGREEVAELAAEQGSGGAKLVGLDLDRIATSSGVAGRVQDAARLPLGEPVPIWGEVPAWVVGVRSAEALRVVAGLADGSVSDEKLTTMAGVGQRALANLDGAPLAFVLDRDDGVTATVLRSRNRPGSGSSWRG